MRLLKSKGIHMHRAQAQLSAEETDYGRLCMSPEGSVLSAGP